MTPPIEKPPLHPAIRIRPMTPREIVLDAFRAACARVDLAGRVSAAVGDAGPFVVIAAGKAATSMFAGVRRVAALV